MKRIICLCAVLAITASLAFAQYGKKATEEREAETSTKKDSESATKDAAEPATFKGILVDNMCFKRHKGDLDEAAENHTTECSIRCVAEGGLGVISDGKLYPFDPMGSKKALAIAKKSKTEKMLTVEVTGTLKGNTLVVSKIEEVAAEGT